jgi:endoglucanase
MENIELVKKLSNTPGVSGDEGKVREILKDEIKEYADKTATDSLGNLVALKGMEKKGPKIMLNAHMDEIGLIIDHINKDGFLQFKKVGGIDDRVLLGKRVLIGEKEIRGVIGAKAIHLQEVEELKKSIKSTELYIDIGAKNMEEAESLTPRGSFAAFGTKFEEITAHKFIGKAFDDRLGCALIVELLKEDYNVPIIALFSTQEEIGLRGAAIGAHQYTPDVAITIEGTISKDRGVITDNELRDNLISTAKQNKIPYQFKQVIVGGTDSYRIQTTKKGVKVLTVAVPVRYLHSPVSLFFKEDYINTFKLLNKFLKKF